MNRLINFQKYLTDYNLNNQAFVEEQEKLAKKRIGIKEDKLGYTEAQQLEDAALVLY